MESDRRFYPYIVVGCGGVGSASVYWLSRRVGSDVLGLEQFQLGHNNGSSQDHSRIIRTVYDDKRYTKLVPETYKAWREVEEESGVKLVHKTGAVFIAKEEHSDTLNDYVTAMDANNLRYERMKGSSIRERFPQFEIDDSYDVMYDPEGGLVDAAMANAVHIQLARGRGARVIENCPVKGVERAEDGNINVFTAKGVFKCRRLVVTPGSWFNEVLGSVGIHIPVYITQEQVTYIATPNIKDFTKERFPVWVYKTNKSLFYGLPIHGNTGVKVALDASGPIVSANTRTFEPDAISEKACRDCLQHIIPKAVGPLLYTKTCLYTSPPDRHLVLDTCARTGWNDVVVFCGAGHAFKWASFIGKILTEMAVDGKSQYDISSFNLDREALTDPNWDPLLQNGSAKTIPPTFTKHTSKL